MGNVWDHDDSFRHNFRANPPQLASNDVNDTGIRHFPDPVTRKNLKCTRDQESMAGVCESQLQGAIRFMHMEFGSPTGEGATMRKAEMRALWMKSEYPAEFKARRPKTCSDGEFGCDTCGIAIAQRTANGEIERTAIGGLVFANEALKDKFCRCMRNKNELDSRRDFFHESNDYAKTCFTRTGFMGAGVESIIAPTTGSFFGGFGKF